jgi:hypothetical protein
MDAAATLSALATDEPPVKFCAVEEDVTVKLRRTTAAGNATEILLMANLF